ncbi:MAG: hypothetical protein WAS56_09955 [Saprospiraceae bacterium]|jgi:uncharacterized membrane protein
MNAITGLGKYFFAIPMLIFGVFHFMGANEMAAMAPGGVISVYFTGACLILFAISVFIGKYDKLAAVLLAFMLLLFVALVHLKSATTGNQMATMSLIKDLALVGGALMYAHSHARDNSIIG